jgi:hypothetical protein
MRAVLVMQSGHRTIVLHADQQQASLCIGETYHCFDQVIVRKWAAVALELDRHTFAFADDLCQV